MSLLLPIEHKLLLPILDFMFLGTLILDFPKALGALISLLPWLYVTESPIDCCCFSADFSFAPKNFMSEFFGPTAISVSVLSNWFPAVMAGFIMAGASDLASSEFGFAVEVECITGEQDAVWLLFTESEIGADLRAVRGIDGARKDVEGLLEHERWGGGGGRIKFDSLKYSLINTEIIITVAMTFDFIKIVLSKEKSVLSETPFLPKNFRTELTFPTTYFPIR